MAKLTKAEREDLAILINGLNVANMMRHEAAARDDYKSEKVWADVEVQRVLELFEKYGIELPTLPGIQERNAA